MSNTPLPEPAYYQWRRRNMPWSLEFAFNSMCIANTNDSEVRTLHPGDDLHAHAAAVSADKDAEIAGLWSTLADSRAYVERLKKRIDELMTAAVRIKVLEGALRTVRQYPDFDDGGPVADMIDDVLADRETPMLQLMDSLEEQGLITARAALGDKTPNLSLSANQSDNPITDTKGRK